MFKIIIGKLKEPRWWWHKYLQGKKLMLMTGLGGVWNLLSIEGEDGLSGLCKYAWDNECSDQHEYKCLSDFIEDVKLGNDGFGFEMDNIEIIEEKLQYDIDKALKESRKKSEKDLELAAEEMIKFENRG